MNFALDDSHVPHSLLQENKLLLHSFSCSPSDSPPAPASRVPAALGSSETGLFSSAILLAAGQLANDVMTRNIERSF